MTDCTYSVIMDGITRANAMTLSDAVIFMKALFTEYQSDTDFQVTIRRTPFEVSMSAPDPDAGFVKSPADKLFF